MLKKKSKFLLLFLVISVIIGIGASYYFLTEQAAITFTPIYCNDYSFTCCIEKVAYTQSFTIDRDDAFICPLTATKCEIDGAQYPYYTGKINCEYKFRPLMLGNTWKCDDESLVQASKNIIIYPGTYAYTTGQATLLNIKVYEQQAIFTGRAGSTVGVPVPGADGCTINPSATYKDGKLVDYDLSGTSYLVPSGDCVMNWVPGDRHICGNIEEKCSEDSDCGGHTYGTYECNGRTLQKYGCKKLSKPYYLEEYSNGYAYTPFSVTEDGSESPLSRCEVISTTTVQCCGDNDCGSNAFCDVGKTWTCKASVQCEKNSDCGSSVIKDVATSSLKTPICKLGKCDYKIEKKDCVDDANCPNGYFCDTDYTCKESAVTKISCPFECCVGEQKFFDKPCPEGSGCLNNLCEKGFEECKRYEKLTETCGLNPLCWTGIIKPIVKCRLKTWVLISLSIAIISFFIIIIMLLKKFLNIK